jgi:hypothetical protein
MVFKRPKENTKLANFMATGSGFVKPESSCDLEVSKMANRLVLGLPMIQKERSIRKLSFRLIYT